MQNPHTEIKDLLKYTIKTHNVRKQLNRKVITYDAEVAWFPVGWRRGHLEGTAEGIAKM